MSAKPGLPNKPMKLPVAFGARTAVEPTTGMQTARALNDEFIHD